MSQHATGLAAGVMVLCATAIGLVQPGLAARVQKVHDTSEIFPLAAPEQMPLMTLGYRAAGADLVWAYVLVAQGLRLQEHRKFDHGPRYFEVISELDPTFREPYLFADSLLASGAKPLSVEDVIAIRALLDRGMQARPNDAKLFLVAGSFLAYVAPSVLPEEMHAPWRIAGARLLQHAAEIGDSDSVQWQALSGASLLGKNGEREAAINFLERVYAITDNDELRAQVERQLTSLRAESAADRVKASAALFDKIWRDDVPFVRRTKILLLGPHYDVYRCAGPQQSGAPACARDWRTWAENIDKAAR